MTAWPRLRWHGACTTGTFTIRPRTGLGGGAQTRKEGEAMSDGMKVLVVVVIVVLAIPLLAYLTKEDTLEPVEPGVTRERFDKIHQGMDLDDVAGLMGFRGVCRWREGIDETGYLPIETCVWTDPNSNGESV